MRITPITAYTPTKPKPPGEKLEFPPDPDAVAERGIDRDEPIPAPKPPSKRSTEELTPEAQKRRLIEAAR